MPEVTIEIDAEKLIEHIVERLRDKPLKDLVRFWDRNFGNDPIVSTDGERILATYED